MEITQATRNPIGMPLLGFGTYQLSPEQAEASVKEALNAGFRHIDSAEGYYNEEGTGKGIKASGISRDDIVCNNQAVPGIQTMGRP